MRFVFVASSLRATLESRTCFHPHVTPPAVFRFILYEYFVGNVARMGEKLIKILYKSLYDIVPVEMAHA